MVSAAVDEFEAGLSKNGQTTEHAILAYTLGIRQLIVCVNKMDMTEPKYSEARYDKIKDEVLSFLKTVGFKPKKITFIPISGWHGDNLLCDSVNMPWCKGMTLLNAIDALSVPKREEGKALRLPLQDVYDIGGIGTVPVGTVDTGVIKAGMTVTFAPKNISGVVKFMEKYHDSLSKACPGDCVGFHVTNVPKTEIRRGYVAGDAKRDPPKAAESFEAQIMFRNHPGEIRVGYCPVVDCHTAHVACKFTELKNKMDPRTGKVIEEAPKSVKAGEICMVVLKPIKPLVVETFKEYAGLGRIVVRDLEQTVGVGLVKSVKKVADK